MQTMLGRRRRADVATRRSLLLLMLLDRRRAHRRELVLHGGHRLLALCKLLLRLCSLALLGGEVVEELELQWRRRVIRRGLLEDGWVLPRRRRSAVEGDRGGHRARKGARSASMHCGRLVRDVGAVCGEAGWVRSRQVAPLSLLLRCVRARIVLRQ